MWSATQIPHILRFAARRRRPGVPESKIRVIAPDVGGGFGGKLQTTPEEFITWCVARRLGKPVKYTETRSESLMSGHHGRDQWQKLTLAADEGRHGHRPQGRAARRPGRLRRASSAAASRCSARSCSTRSTSSRPTTSTVQTVLTNKTWTDAYRGAGPAGGDVRHRAADGRARRRAGRRPAGDPGEELDQARGVPVHHRRRAGVRLRQLRGRHRAGQGDVRVRRAAGRAGGSAGPAATRSSSASASRPSPRCAAWRPAGCSGSLNYGAGGWEHAERPDAAHRQGRGRSPARPRTARATRRRSARSSPTGSAWRSRTSRCCTATPRSPHKGLDTYGSRSLVVGGEALVKAADKVIEKAKPIAAHLLEASVDDLEFAGGRFSVARHRPGPGASARSRWRRSRRTTCPTGSSPRSTRDATYDPVNFNYPHGTHLCAMEVDTETGAVKMRKYVCCRRHRQHHQPADRRGSGARRPGPGHRPGAVGGGGVRRRRDAGVRLVRRLPAADRGRHDQLRDRPHHQSRATTNTLGTKGVGEAGTIASTPAVVNAVVDAVRHLGRQRHRRCRARRSGSGEPSTVRRDHEGAAMPHFDQPDTVRQHEGAGA